MSDTIRAYGSIRDLRDFDETRSYEIRGVTFIIARAAHRPYWRWRVEYKGKIMDGGAPYDTAKSVEEAFADMAARTKDAEEYVKLYDEQEEQGKRFAAYFEEHGTIPTGMSDLDAILNGEEEQ